MPKRTTNKDPKPYKISVLLTKKESQTIDSVAVLLDVKRATAFKALAFQDVEKLERLERIIGELKKIEPTINLFNNELRRIGNNVNQITYVLNSGQHPLELAYCVKQLHTFFAMIETKLMPIWQLEVP